MPGGIDTQYGINYQNLVGVLRVLEFLSISDLMSIEFESQNEQLEDINLEYLDVIVYEQVKKREHAVWNKPSIKIILSKFANLYTKSKLEKAINFKFTTNTSYDGKILELMNIQKEIQESKKISKAKIEILKGFFDSKYNQDTIVDIIRKTKFVWNYYAPHDALIPFQVILNECESRTEKSVIIIDDHKNVISKILIQVMEFSSTKLRPCKYTAFHFEKITGIPAFENEFENIQQKLGKEYKDVILSFKPILVRNDLKIKNKRLKFRVPIYLEFENHIIALWIISMKNSTEEFKKINDVLKQVDEFNHLVIALKYDEEYATYKYHFKQELLIDSSNLLSARLKQIMR